MRKELMQELLNLYERVEKTDFPKGTKEIIDNYIRKLELKLIKELERKEREVK